MRKLGQEMAVSPMAVYRYFPNQVPLLAGVVEMLWRAVLTIAPATAEAPWQQQIIHLKPRYCQTLLAHPHVLPLISARPLATRSAFALVDKILTAWTKMRFCIQSTLVFQLNSLTA